MGGAANDKRVGAFDREDPAIRSTFGRRERRVPVEAPWLLGHDAECVVDGLSVILRDPGAGSEVRLTVFDFAGRAGQVLRFCSRAGPIGARSIEFAGLSRDAWFDVTCRDEATAERVAAWIDKPFADAP